MIINSPYITGSINVSGVITGSLSGSVTGSFYGTANITGSLRVSGSTNMSASSYALAIQGSGSGVFTVDGTSGRLFQVDDSLSGSLFSVNTAAGLPVIEAFSDNTVRIGQFGQKVLFVSQSKVGVGTETPVTNLDVSGSVRITNGLSETGSVNISGSVTMTGSFTTSGTITAQTLVVQTITSSIEYSSGSNIFGSRLTDTQTFTGSVNITGSLTAAGNINTGGDLISTKSVGFTMKTTTTGAWSAVYGDTGGLYLGTNAGNWMSIMNSGYIGVGTAAPKNIFQITNLTSSGVLPAVGAIGIGTSLYLTNNNTGYGMLLGSLPTGDSWIQAQRTDGTATTYNLQLQPNGGNVYIASNLNFGSMTIFNGNTVGNRTITTTPVTLQTTDQLGGGNTGNLSIVSGIASGNGGIAFVDIVLWMYGGTTPTVISSQTTGAAVGRTYSISSSANLQLDMASGTYVVSSNTFRQSYTN